MSRVGGADAAHAGSDGFAAASRRSAFSNADMYPSIPQLPVPRTAASNDEDGTKPSIPRRDNSDIVARATRPPASASVAPGVRESACPRCGSLASTSWIPRAASETNLNALESPHRRILEHRRLQVDCSPEEYSFFIVCDARNDSFHLISPHLIARALSRRRAQTRAFFFLFSPLCRALSPS